MFSYVTLEQRVPQDHPLREIRRLTDVVLRSLSAEFEQMYSASGRPSIAPEYVLRALLLQAFYSVRSERQLVEQLDYNLLFRWFVGLGMDDAVISLSRRWLVEKGFGWLKQTGPVRQVKLRGLHKVDWIFIFSCAVHNLMRLPRLIAHQALEGLQQQCA